MAKRKASSAEEAAVQVEEVAAPAFNVSNLWEHYQHYILYALIGVAVLVGGWFAYKNFVVAPKQKEAVAAMWQAQMQFERDSFKLALENPGGGYDGFVTLADKFSGTPAGNTANYYAGICYLQTGDIDNAIKYLEDFSPEGTMLPITANGALGDCYSEKKDFDKALSYYKKAADAGDNEVLTPYYLKKMGMLYEYTGKAEDARAAYEKVRKNYPNSPDGREIEKYLYRVGGGQD